MADTIFAVSSGVGRAAIAIIRLSGPQAADTLRLMTGSVPKPRFAKLSKLRNDSGLVLDEALVLYFPAPRSETGEDLVELQVHGGRAVVAAILQCLGRCPGLRPAEPGEFARRALANGKMGLLDVEALADLIDAETEWQRRQALEGGGSLLRGKAETWRALLLDIRSDLEAAIDFSDEGDVSDRLDSQAERNLGRLQGELAMAISLGQRGERVRDGFVVALCGPPNAGKSSLLNALAGRDVAIVSPEPGTTRDRIEVAMDLNGVPVVLVDTAGIRDEAGPVELEGIRRARELLRKADLSLWLSPVDDPVEPDGELAGDRLVRVTTKCDLAEPGCDGMRISVKTGAGLGDLLSFLTEVAAEALGREPSILTRERHIQLVSAAARSISDALGCVGEPELCAEHLRIAQLSLDRLIGHVGIEDVLGQIFSRFCVGK